LVQSNPGPVAPLFRGAATLYFYFLLELYQIEKLGERGERGEADMRKLKKNEFEKKNLGERGLSASPPLLLS